MSHWGHLSWQTSAGKSTESNQQQLTDNQASQTQYTPQHPPHHNIENHEQPQHPHHQEELLQHHHQQVQQMWQQPSSSFYGSAVATPAFAVGQHSSVESTFAMQQAPSHSSLQPPNTSYAQAYLSRKQPQPPSYGIFTSTELPSHASYSASLPASGPPPPPPLPATSVPPPFALGHHPAMIHTTTTSQWTPPPPPSASSSVGHAAPHGAPPPFDSITTNSWMAPQPITATAAHRPPPPPPPPNAPPAPPAPPPPPPPLPPASHLPSFVSNTPSLPPPSYLPRPPLPLPPPNPPPPPPPHLSAFVPEAIPLQPPSWTAASSLSFSSSSWSTTRTGQGPAGTLSAGGTMTTAPSAIPGRSILPAWAYSHHPTIPDESQNGSTWKGSTDEPAKNDQGDHGLHHDQDEESHAELAALVRGAVSRMEAALRAIHRRGDAPPTTDDRIDLTQARDELLLLLRRANDASGGGTTTTATADLAFLAREADSLIRRADAWLLLHPPPPPVSPTQTGPLGPIPAEPESSSMTTQRHSLSSFGGITEQLPSTAVGGSSNSIVAEQGTIAPSTEPEPPSNRRDPTEKCSPAEERVLTPPNGPPHSSKVKSLNTLAKTKLAKALMTKKVELLKAKAKWLESSTKDKSPQLKPPPPSAARARLRPLTALQNPLTLQIDTSVDPDRVVLVDPSQVAGDIDDEKRGPSNGTTALDDEPGAEVRAGPAIADDALLQQLLTHIPAVDVVQRKRRRSDEPPPEQSREALRKRRREAERHRAETLCKNLIVKHEVLEAEQAGKLRDTDAAIRKAEEDLEAHRLAVERNRHESEALRMRKRVVDEILHDYVIQLVNARKVLHDHTLLLERPPAGKKKHQ